MELGDAYETPYGSLYITIIVISVCLIATGLTYIRVALEKTYQWTKTRGMGKVADHVLEGNMVSNTFETNPVKLES